VYSTLGHVQPAATLAEAVAALTDLGDEGTAIAGGTWVMRAAVRGGAHASAKAPRRYVALKRIPELSGCAVTAEAIALGSLLTHTELARIDAGPAYACVRDAARKSAFPQVRNVATVGGNIATIGFAEADLVPALLAAQARVELSGPASTTTMPLEKYLAERTRRPHGELIARIHVPTPARRASAFERLTVRAQGEYPIVNVAVSVDVTGDVITGARVAVGSVEPAARLCASAAAQLTGRPVGDPAATKAAGEAAAAELTARDGLDAPGWYRLAVLPALVRRAIARIPATL
jgi:carbon-monoxide dehydrogenase medium subunit